MVVALGAYFGERRRRPATPRGMAARRTARRRRLELRGARAVAVVVVQHDDPRARGPARGRAVGRRRPGRSRPPARAARSTSSSGGCSGRCSTGAVINPTWTRFSFPPQWHYDVLRGLEYFRAAGAPPDPRAPRPSSSCTTGGEATGDGRCSTPTARTHFEMEEGDGKPSRWNTLRACGCCAGTTASGRLRAVGPRAAAYTARQARSGELAAEGGDHVGSRVPHVLRDAPGESPAVGHEDWIELLSWSWGVTASAPVRRTRRGVGGGGGAGRPDPSALVWEHFFDAASTQLLGFVASGRHVPKAELHVTRGGRDAWLVVKMTDVTITSVVTSGSAEGEVEQTVGMEFRSVRVRVPAAAARRLARRARDVRLGHPPGHRLDHAVRHSAATSR